MIFSAFQVDCFADGVSKTLEFFERTIKIKCYLARSISIYDYIPSVYKFILIFIILYLMFLLYTLKKYLFS